MYLVRRWACILCNSCTALWSSRWKFCKLVKLDCCLYVMKNKIQGGISGIQYHLEREMGRREWKKIRSTFRNLHTHQTHRIRCRRIIITTFYSEHIHSLSRGQHWTTCNFYIDAPINVMVPVIISHNGEELPWCKGI